jgi:DNA modification methylase
LPGNASLAPTSRANCERTHRLLSPTKSPFSERSLSTVKIPFIVSHIELWPIDRLIPYARNPRSHSAEQVAQIAASEGEFGVVNPALVDVDGNIIAGHGRILAARKNGLTDFPVIVLDHLTPSQVRKLRIADNRIAENARWDEEKLSAELATLLEEQVDLTSLGFDKAELDHILDDLESQNGHTDEDAIPDPIKQGVAKLGDLFLLGDHRMLCGDSTWQANLAEVLEGRQADLIYGDFPYNVAYQSPKSAASASRRSILNDDLGKDFPKFLRDSCVALLAVSRGAIYLSMSSSELHTLYKAFTDAGGHWSTYVIWVKSAFTLGRSDYQRIYEPILYGWKQGSKHFFCGARNLADAWFIDKPRVNDLHPTMKPVELIEKIILNSSQKGDLVLDPFAGASPTLIACHKTGRRARLIELDPKYVDVSIIRWQQFSGLKATRASDGRSFDDIAAEGQQ